MSPLITPAQPADGLDEVTGLDDLSATAVAGLPGAPCPESRSEWVSEGSRPVRTGAQP